MCESPVWWYKSAYIRNDFTITKLSIFRWILWTNVYFYQKCIKSRHYHSIKSYYNYVHVHSVVYRHRTLNPTFSLKVEHLWLIDFRTYQDCYLFSCVCVLFRSCIVGVWSELFGQHLLDCRHRGLEL